MPPSRKYLSPTQAIVVFILSFAAFAEFFLILNLHTSGTMLIVRSLIGSSIITLFMWFRGKRVMRLFLTMFYKEMRYDKPPKKNK